MRGGARRAYRALTYQLAVAYAPATPRTLTFVHNTLDFGHTGFQMGRIDISVHW